MSNLASQLFTISAGQTSQRVSINLTGTRAIASIATNSNLTLDGNGKVFMKFKAYCEKLDAWLYVYNASTKADGQLQIISGKVLSFIPSVDLRGQEQIEFELSVAQANDVTFEIKFTVI